MESESDRGLPSQVKSVLDQCHQLCGHWGVKRTISLVERRYEVKDLAEVTKAYVRVCHECQILKFDKSKKYGWLNPVPIRQAKWQHISLDWIEPLPPNQGKNSIMAVID